MWALDWKSTLEELGLMSDREPYGPICRAPNSDGTFTKRPLTPSEVSDMLNEFLETTGGDGETTSHSLKAKALVWCARYVVGDKERAMLGHHAIKENSMACYSRDLLAGPKRMLCAMLLNMRLGNYTPDGTRSAWMAGKQVPLEFRCMESEDEVGSQGEKSLSYTPSLPSAAPLGKQRDVSADPTFDPCNPFGEKATDEWHDAPLGDPESGEEFVGSSASSSDEDSEGETDNEEVFHGKMRSPIESGVAQAVPGPLMQNKRSRMLHKQSGEEADHKQPVTECGLSGPGFVVLENGASFVWPKCSKCFKKSGKDTNISAEYVAEKRRRKD